MVSCAHAAHSVVAVQPRFSDRPLRSRRLRHERFEHERHRQRDDTDEHALDAAIEDHVADQRGGDDAHRDARAETEPRLEPHVAVVQREDAVGVARQSEERGLSERQDAAVAPHCREAERAECPQQAVREVAAGVRIDHERQA